MPSGSPPSPVVLVTGVHGFLASHVTKILLDEGYRVRGTLRSLGDEAKVKTLREVFGGPDKLELVQADLTSDLGWDDAVRGCKYVMHVASPLPRGPPKDEQELIRPAVEGTKRVLRASARATDVSRFVLTSSISAVHGEDIEEKGRMYTEADWSDPSCRGMEAYSRSKTLAELAAWELLENLRRVEGTRLEMTVLNPGLLLGPPLTGSLATSLDVVKSMLAGWNGGMTAPLHCCVCDVRDAALAHVRAMILPEAQGERHIIATRCAWMIELACLLSRDLSPLGYRLPTRTAPHWAIWLISFVDGGVALAYRRMGKEFRYANTRMRQVLGIEPRDLRITLLETAHALMDMGLVMDKRAKTKAPNLSAQL